MAYITKVFHIVGPSGSGKTTLGKKIAATGMHCIDADDIHDAIALDLLAKSPPIKTSAGEEKFSNKVIGKVHAEIAKMISRHSGPIFSVVGMTIDFRIIKKLLHEIFAQRKPSRKIEFCGFVLMVDAATVWRQVNLRHLEQIKTHGSEIERLIKSAEYAETAQLLLLFKYKLRLPFVMEEHRIVNGLEWIKKTYEKQKYTFASSHEIFNAITAAT